MSDIGIIRALEVADEPGEIVALEISTGTPGIPGTVEWSAAAGGGVILTGGQANPNPTPALARQADLNGLAARVATLEGRPLPLTLEEFQDQVAAMFPGATYNDTAGTITLPPGSDPEAVRDTVAAFVKAGLNVTVTHDDAGDTLTLGATGGTGGTAVNPLLVTGLTGGTPGNLVLRIAGTNTTIDAHPSMKDELRRGLLYWRATDGSYYAPGGTVPGFSGLTPGHYVALSGKTTAGGRNWTTFAGDIPAVLDGTATQVYVEVGSTETDTLIRFQPRAAYSEADDTALYTQTAWSDYTLNTAGVLAGVFDDVWTASTKIEVIADATYPGGRALHQAMGSTSARRHLAYKPHGQYVDGQVLAVGLMKFANVKQIQVALRVSGAVGAETALVAQVDGVAGAFRLIAFVGGVVTVLHSSGIAAVTENTQYVIQLDAKGTRIRGRMWIRGEVAPAWREVYSDLVMGAGSAGMGGRTGDAYFPAVGIVKGYGDVPLEIAA